MKTIFIRILHRNDGTITYQLVNANMENLGLLTEAHAMRLISDEEVPFVEVNVFVGSKDF